MPIDDYFVLYNLNKSIGCLGKGFEIVFPFEDKKEELVNQKQNKE